MSGELESEILADQDDHGHDVETGGAAEQKGRERREVGREIRSDELKDVLRARQIFQAMFAEITLTTFYCRLVDGEPRLSEHSAVQWLRPQDLNSVDWAPADIPAVALVKAHLG